MPVKNRQHSSKKSPRIARHGLTTTKQNGVVEAVIIHKQPNLTMYLTLQNTLNYFIDSINQYMMHHEHHSLQHGELTRCTASIRKFYTEHASQLHRDLQQLLTEFLEETDNFNSIIQSMHSNNSSPRILSKDSLSHLTARVSRLQWLSVCIMQEMKQAYLHS